jgi:hypothetical protein
MWRRKKLNTAANLIGGLLLGLTGYVAMEVHRTTQVKLGETMPFWLSLVSGGCFFVFGWNGLGHNAGFGGMRSLANGLRATLLAAMATCIVFGLIFICGQLLGGYYLDPFKTIFAWFRISFEYFIDTFSVPVWTILIIGGLISGRLTGMANWRWR